MHSNTKKDDRYRTKLEKPLLDRSGIKVAEVGIIARKTWERKDVVLLGEWESESRTRTLVKDGGYRDKKEKANAFPSV